MLSDKTPVCTQKFGCDANYHKIECPVEPEKEQTQDTLCRCDARNDYILSHSESRDICVPGKYADCYEWKCPDGQERLLNYTCAPRCKEGFQRYDSDTCVPKITVVTMPQGVTEKALPTSTTSSENSLNGNSSGGINTNENSPKGNSSGDINLNYAMTAFVATVVCVAIILLSVVVCLACWKWKLYKKCQNALNRLRRQSSEDQTRSNDMELQPFNRDTNANARPSDTPSLEGPSQEQLHRKVLNRCLPELMKRLNVKDVMRFIQQKELFDDVTTRDIREQRTTSDAISLLIEKIQQTSREKYEKFKKCLAKARQKDLIKMLEEVEAEVTKEIKETHQAQVTAYETLDMDVSLPGNSFDAN